MKSFIRTKIQDLEHNVTPHLDYDKPDIAVMNKGSRNVSHSDLAMDASILANDIIKIVNKCIDYDVEKVVISSVFVQEIIRLSFPKETLMMKCVFYVPLINFILFLMITSLESVYVAFN